MNLQPSLLADAMVKLKPSPLALRPRLLPPRQSVLLPPSRSAASTHRAQNANRSPDNKPLGIHARRIMPSDNKDFMDFKTGQLRTTPEVYDWLSRTGIHHDSGIMYRLRDPVVMETSRKFDALVYYSPEYVIHPYHVKRLTPRRHPGAQEQCTRYEIKMRDEPLWIHTSCFGSDKAVVRAQIKRRLKARLHMALRRMGYDDVGWAKNKVVKGTVGIHIHKPLTGIREDATKFSAAIALAVEKESQRIFGKYGNGTDQGIEEESKRIHGNDAIKDAMLTGRRQA